MEAKANVCVGELNEMLKGVVEPEMSEIHEQCIYKVPPGIREANPHAYTPKIISIGPFHSPHGSSSDNIDKKKKKSSDNFLHQMEELKLKYLKGFLKRTKLSLNGLVLKLQELEDRIRSCYAAIFSFNSNDFLKIITIDACFIIEHFLRVFRYKDWIQNDPILLKPWLHNHITRDLVLLENQLPFFVLEEIYTLASLNPEYPSFLTITIKCFGSFNLQKLNREQCPTPKHFTDLLRTFLLPPSLFDFVQEEPGDAIEHVYNVSQLPEAELPSDDFVPEEPGDANELVYNVSQLPEAELPSDDFAQEEPGDAIELVYTVSQLPEVTLTGSARPLSEARPSDANFLVGRARSLPEVTLTGSARPLSESRPSDANFLVGRARPLPEVTLKGSARPLSEAGPSSDDFVQEKTGKEIVHLYSVSRLSEAGLVFDLSKSKGLVDLDFDDDKGVLIMPCFHVDDITETHMRNILAFEECHISDQDKRYISQYLSILDFLINTEKDVSILADKEIIVNWMGDANEAATMVNNLCRNATMPKLNTKYKSLCDRLNRFYENPMNRYKAIFIHEYFNTPWKIASTVAAVLLLLLTLIQTVCSICSL